MRSVAMNCLYGLAAAALLCLSFKCPNSEGAELRAGVGVRNITADKPTAPVHDALQAKALVLDDGNHRVVFVAVDMICVSTGLVQNVRRKIREALEFDVSCLLLSATHNHHTLGQIAEDVDDRIVEAVRQALTTMAPARIGSGTGEEGRITMNRRLRMDSGKHWTIRRAIPSPPDDQVVALGPVDTEIGLLRVDSADGRPLALIYNFAGHAYGGIGQASVTADFPGFASRTVEVAWPGAAAIFLQGAAGDITPVGYKNFDVPPPTERLGNLLGLSALKAAQQIETSPDVSIDILCETIELPVRTDLEERIASLESQQEDVLDLFVRPGCGTHGAGTTLDFESFLPLYLKHLADPDHPAVPSYLYDQQSAGQQGLEELDADNRKRIERYLECVEAMEKLIRIRTNLVGLQRQLDKPATGPLSAEIQAIRIGRFALVTFPGEPFAEVGLRIKRQSPFPETFLAAYANGCVGYAPTADAYSQEAYEDISTRLAPQWQAVYETKAIEMLKRLHEGVAEQ